MESQICTISCILLHFACFYSNVCYCTYIGQFPAIKKRLACLTHCKERLLTALLLNAVLPFAHSCIPLLFSVFSFLHTYPLGCWPAQFRWKSLPIKPIFKADYLSHSSLDFYPHHDLRLIVEFLAHDFSYLWAC